MSKIADVLSLVGNRRRTRVYDKPKDTGLASYIEEYSTPIGTIISKFSSITPGDSWLLVAGQSLSKADYAELYADIGGMFGEDATTFNLPNLSDKYLTGSGALAVGADAGANTINLSIDQLPAHSHGITDTGHTHTFTGTPHGHAVTDPGHTHTAAAVDTANLAATSAGAGNVAVSGNTSSTTTGLTVDNATAEGSNTSETTGVSVDNTGSGNSIDNRPASIAVHYFIKTRV